MEAVRDQSLEPPSPPLWVEKLLDRLYELDEELEERNKERDGLIERLEEKGYTYE